MLRLGTAAHPRSHRLAEVQCPPPAVAARASSSPARSSECSRHITGTPPSTTRRTPTAAHAASCCQLQPTPARPGSDRLASRRRFRHPPMGVGAASQRAGALIASPLSSSCLCSRCPRRAFVGRQPRADAPPHPCSCGIAAGPRVNPDSWNSALIKAGDQRLPAVSRSSPARPDAACSSPTARAARVQRAPRCLLPCRVQLSGHSKEPVSEPPTQGAGEATSPAMHSLARVTPGVSPLDPREAS